MFYTRIIRPIFFKTDPEWIHHVIIKGLNVASRIWPLNFWLEKFCLIRDPRLTVKISGLSLMNPVGLPAGFDKYVEAPYAHGMMGYGFAELGSITYSEQPGNPKPRLWRIPKDKGLIVYYGLSNSGAQKSIARLKNIRRRPTPLGVSIAPTTGLTIDQMAEDYLKSFILLHAYADFITLNVSCPNVASCDVFSQISFIKELVEKIMQTVRAQKIVKNIFLKIGPDMKIEDMDQVIDVCVANGITGIVATNLIKKREGITPQSSVEQLNHPGGISGMLLQSKSDAVIKRIRERAGDKLKIIGVGGIFSAEDAYRKIKLGASAVQVFTGFIYNGPFFIRQLNKDMIKLLERDGYKNISEAVGKDVVAKM
ncbi:MAG: quinone-dependent dihydroorotate dehydrogenase [Candidatus Magasanikbacteria bacterium]|jgi:dihydroorotate dehydrogenase